MSNSTQVRKAALIVGAIVALWYGFVLSMPEVADAHGVPALPMAVQNAMCQLSISQPSYDEAAAQLDRLGWTMSMSTRQVSYQFELSRHNSASWELVARPDRDSVYCYPLWKRILWADFCKHRMATYRIRAGEQYPEEIE